MEMPKATLEPVKRSTLTAEETATYLGVSLDLVYKECRENRLVHFRIGRRLLFRKEAIDRWIDEQMDLNTNEGN